MQKQSFLPTCTIGAPNHWCQWLQTGWSNDTQVVTDRSNNCAIWTNCESSEHWHGKSGWSLVPFAIKLAEVLEMFDNFMVKIDKLDQHAEKLSTTWSIWVHCLHHLEELQPSNGNTRHLAHQLELVCDLMISPNEKWTWSNTKKVTLTSWKRLKVASQLLASVTKGTTQSLEKTTWLKKERFVRDKQLRKERSAVVFGACFHSISLRSESLWFLNWFAFVGETLCATKSAIVSKNLITLSIHDIHDVVLTEFSIVRITKRFLVIFPVSSQRDSSTFGECVSGH